MLKIRLVMVAIVLVEFRTNSVDWYSFKDSEISKLKDMKLVHADTATLLFYQLTESIP